MDKKLAYFAILISFCITVISMYFSVSGWMALFSAAAIGTMFMFGIIEIGKVVAVAVLHWFWDTMPKLQRTVLALMVAIIMLITSVGIFGYLSKGHLDQNLPSTTIQIQIEGIEKNIALENDKIVQAENRISQLDDIVNALVEYKKISGNDGARAVRESQNDERKLLQDVIQDGKNLIKGYYDNLNALKTEHTEISAKLGPIEYIVDLFGVSDKDFAVQLMILLAIFVFDPFSIMLFISALWILKRSVEVPLKAAYKDVEVDPLDNIEEVLDASEPVKNYFGGWIDRLK